jgi:hypothetical protein
MSVFRLFGGGFHAAPPAILRIKVMNGDSVENPLISPKNCLQAAMEEQYIFGCEKVVRNFGQAGNLLARVRMG